MRHLLAGLALALLIASPVYGKAGASITAGGGPYAFGQTVPTFDLVAGWTPKNGRQPDGGYWARADCYQNGSVVYAQYADLTTPIYQSGFTFGPTPSWSGGAASCTVRLVTFDNGVPRYVASDDFLVLAALD